MYGFAEVPLRQAPMEPPVGRQSTEWLPAGIAEMTVDLDDGN